MKFEVKQAQVYWTTVCISFKTATQFRKAGALTLISGNIAGMQEGMLVVITPTGGPSMTAFILHIEHWTASENQPGSQGGSHDSAKDLSSLMDYQICFGCFWMQSFVHLSSQVQLGEIQGMIINARTWSETNSYTIHTYGPSCVPWLLYTFCSGYEHTLWQCCIARTEAILMKLKHDELHHRYEWSYDDNSCLHVHRQQSHDMSLLSPKYTSLKSPAIRRRCARL